MSYRETITYTAVSVKAVRRGRCPGCQKRVTRSQTFTNTISPFNRNPDGTVRTYQEVQARVTELAASWEPGPEVFRHQACGLDS